MLEVLGIKNADKLVPVDEDQTPRDPISENMSFLTGKPTKAFIYQDHDAHIATHMALIQDPSIAAAMGQTPMAQQMQAAVAAHISEHLAFSYRAKVEEQLGVQLPAPDAQMDEDTEVQVSKLVAQASQQLLKSNQNKAQQAQQAQAAQQAAQDPKMQMQQAEIQLQQQDLQRKQQKDVADNQIAQKRLDLDAQRIQADAVKEAQRVQSQKSLTEMKLKLDAYKHMAPQSKPQGIV
jgi:hypothetical protein